MAAGSPSLAAGCVAVGSSSSGRGWAPASLQPWSEGGGAGLVGGCSEGSSRDGLAEVCSSTAAASTTAVPLASGGGWAWTAQASTGAATTAEATTAATAAEAVAAAAALTGVQATLWRMGVLPPLCGGLAGAGGVAGCSGTWFEAASVAAGLAGARSKARSSTSLTRGVEACGDRFALAAIAAAAFTAAIAADAVAAAAARTGVCGVGERSRTGAKSAAALASAWRGDASSGEGVRRVASSGAEASAAATAAASSAEAAPAPAPAGEPAGGVNACSDSRARPGAGVLAGARSGSEASCGRGDPCVGDTSGDFSASDRREGEGELVTTSLASASGSSASKAVVAVEACTCSSPRGTSPVPVGDPAGPLGFSGSAATFSCDSSDAALNWS